MNCVLMALLWTAAPSASEVLEPGVAVHSKGVLSLETTAGKQRVLKAIDRGLAFLDASQSKEVGAVGEKYQVALTSLSGLAFLGAGYGYDRGKYGRNVALCVRFLLRTSQSERSPGFIAKAGEDHPMHGHAYALLFLTQVYGELPVGMQKDVRAVIHRGVQVIASAMSFRGGWDYAARNERQQDENTVTVCVLQALRAARNVGFSIDKNLVDKADQYLKACQKADGSFRYSLSRSVKWSSYELTTGAVASLQVLGKYRTPAVKSGLAFLQKKLAKQADNPLAAAERYPFYGNFYAAQAFYQAGDRHWRAWYPLAFQRLIEAGEKNDGHWKSRYGDAYATAMAALMLEVPLGFLPIFQR